MSGIQIIKMVQTKSVMRPSNLPQWIQSPCINKADPTCSHSQPSRRYRFLKVLRSLLVIELWSPDWSRDRMKAMPPRNRRNAGLCFEALRDDPGLLLLRPPAPTLHPRDLLKPPDHWNTRCTITTKPVPSHARNLPAGKSQDDPREPPRSTCRRGTGYVATVGKVIL